MPCVIFNYRDYSQAMQLLNHEDGLPLYVYKGLTASEKSKQDDLNIISGQK